MPEFEQIPRRSWTSDEQLIVARGFSGRVFIAIEPLICTIVFIVLTIAPFYLTSAADLAAQHAGRVQFTLAQVLAPIMAFGAVGFGIYTFALMVKPVRALWSTFAPIYIVDGYLEYKTASSKRGHRHTSVTILLHDGSTVQSWHATTLLAVNDGVYPAMVEFSRYGGILKIDGRPIGPPLFAIAPFGIGSFNEHIVTTASNYSAKP